MRKSLKKGLSFIMCLCVFFSAGVCSFAEDLQEEPIEWIEIYTYEDLDDVRYDLTKNYKLMNDIDMTEFVKPGGDYDFFGQGWNPIGSNDLYGSTEFNGIFDGNGHTISGLRMDVTTFPAGTGDHVYFGLFSRASGTVKNLTVTGEITISDQNKNNWVGGIAAVSNSGTLENCTNIVEINVNSYNSRSVKRSNMVGGIVGSCGGVISNCRNIANISSTAGGVSYQLAGGTYCNENVVSGINGCCDSRLIIRNCINIGNISGKSSRDGYSISNGITWRAKEISNCYNCGSINTVKLTDSYYACFSYGIAEDGIIKNCYSIGTVSGTNCNYAISNSTSTNCYYLRGTGTTSEGATERTEAQMKRQITFQDWDFENVWTMEGRDDYFYPELRDVELITPDDINRTPIDGTVSIDGEIGVGNTLTANVDAITPENATVSYAWTIDGEQVGDAESYQITESDIGKTITLTVSGTGDYRGKLSAQLLLEKDHAHSYIAEVTKDPTCSAEGIKTYTCYCGDSYTETIPTIPHTPGEWEVETPATAAQEGKEIIKCTVCSEILEERTIPEVIGAIPGTLYLDKKPTKIAYELGEAFDPTGAVLRVKYNDGSIKAVSVDDVDIVDFDTTTGGNKKVHFSYTENGVTLNTWEFTILVDRQVTAIFIPHKPNKTHYICGEAFEREGMEIIATYSDGTKADVTAEVRTSGYDSLAFGLKKMTVSYTYKGKTVTLQFSYEMNPKLVGLELTHKPNKLGTYKVGEPLSKKGMIITAKFSDGSTKDVTHLIRTSGYSSKQVGKQIITVSYTYGTQTKSVQFSIIMSQT